MFQQAILQEVPASLRRWLLAVNLDGSAGAHARAYAAAPEVVGAQRWHPRREAVLLLRSNNLGWTLHSSRLCDVARMAIVIALARSAGTAAVRELYQQLPCSERPPIARALSLLPQPKTLMPLAIDAASAQDVELFSAIAFANPYPANFFSNGALESVVRRVASSRLNGEIMNLEPRITPAIRAIIEARPHLPRSISEPPGHAAPLIWDETSSVDG